MWREKVRQRDYGKEDEEMKRIKKHAVGWDECGGSKELDPEMVR